MRIPIVEISNLNFILCSIMWLLSMDINAAETLKSNDSIDHPVLTLEKHYKFETVGIKPMANLCLNFRSGAYINKTLGIHPILNIPVGIKYTNNFFIIDYERRFGNSKQKYFILDNNSLEPSNAFNGQCIGLAYERILHNSDFNMILLHSGLGYDWFDIPENNSIQNKKIIGGLNLNFGLGYSFYFNKKHGPGLFIIYNYSDLRNEGGTKINSNSIDIRLSYNFGHELNKKEKTDGWLVNQSLRQEK